MRTTNAELLNNPGAWVAGAYGDALAALQAFLPQLLLALIQILVAWAGAWLLRLVILHFGRGLDRLLATLNQAPATDVQRARWSIAGITANVAFWVVIAFGVSSAAATVGLVLLASWLDQLLGYLPRLVISGLIMFIGYLVSRGLRDLVTNLAATRSLEHGGLLAQTASGLVLAFALLLALNQLGLDVGLLTSILVLAFAALFGGAALAFGLGAADAVRNIMASHYLRRLYQPGTLVRVGDQEGEILELTPVGVLLETEQGQAFIPARRFMELGSLMLELDDEDGA